MSIAYLKEYIENIAGFALKYIAKIDKIVHFRKNSFDYQDVARGCVIGCDCN